ncbi:MAG: hypothetical protein C0518_08275 [Opitutus sp.]|nr:hypothetical protein [Opitutus sp.]
MKSATLSRPLRTAKRCWIQGRRIYVEADASRTFSFPASKYPNLDRASQADLEKLSLNAAATAIEWATIDEQILIEDAATNRFVHTPRSLPAPANPVG